MYDPTVVRVTTLSVLTSLVDGKATSGELDVIAKEISSEYKTTEAEVRKLAEGLLKAYEKKKTAKDPVALVKLGQNALGALQGAQRTKCIRIAKKVAMSGGLNESEATFLDSLDQYVRRYRR